MSLDVPGPPPSAVDLLDRKSASDTWTRWFFAMWRALTGVQGLVRSGSGSPEGSLTAPIGSVYLRLDGGAGSTLYVKESGSGNVGWASK